MSKIPFSFIAIPRIFYRNGILNPNNKSFANRIVFLNWAFSKCYTVPCINEGVTYDAYEFSCSTEKAAKEMGITGNEAESLFNFFVRHKFLYKSNSPIKNRSNRYRWDISKFTMAEKIVEISAQFEEEKEPSKGKEEHFEEEKRDQLREEISKTPEPNPKFRNQLRNQNGTISRVENPQIPEPTPEPTPPFYRNDIETIESSSLYSDNEYKSRARDLSLSCKGKITDFFIPSRYKLRDGSFLSLRTQNAFAKYQGEQKEKLLANIRFYEEYCDSGKPIKTTHEKFLQYCVSKNLAIKKENCGRNHLSAQFMKEMYDLKGMQILKTVIKLTKDGQEEPISISKELPPQTFDRVLDNYLNYYQEQLKYAT